MGAYASRAFGVAMSPSVQRRELFDSCELTWPLTTHVCG